MDPHGQPLNFHYDRAERLAHPSASAFQKAAERRQRGRRKQRRLSPLFFVPLLVVAALFLFLRNRQPAYEHELDGYALTLKAEAVGEQVYASLAVLKVREAGSGAREPVQVVFRSPGGDTSPRFSRSPPVGKGEVEIISTIFQDGAASEVSAEVAVGSKSLILSSPVRRSPP